MCMGAWLACLCAMCVQCLQRLEEGTTTLDLELQAVMSYVGSGDPESEFHAYTANTLPTRLSLRSK